jgi:hypothetical protein
MVASDRSHCIATLNKDERSSFRGALMSLERLCWPSLHVGADWPETFDAAPAANARGAASGGGDGA